MVGEQHRERCLAAAWERTRSSSSPASTRTAPSRPRLLTSFELGVGVLCELADAHRVPADVVEGDAGEAPAGTGYDPVLVGPGPLGDRSAERSSSGKGQRLPSGAVKDSDPTSNDLFVVGRVGGSSADLASGPLASYLRVAVDRRDDGRFPALLVVHRFHLAPHRRRRRPRVVNHCVLPRDLRRIIPDSSVRHRRGSRLSPVFHGTATRTPRLPVAPFP